MIDESDLEEEDNIDSDEQTDERNVQSNDLLLTNEYAIKNEVVMQSETVTSSRAAVAKARPSSTSVTREAESKSEHKQGKESSKPVHTTKLRKKVEFVIEFPVVNS